MSPLYFTRSCVYVCIVCRTQLTRRHRTGSPRSCKLYTFVREKRWSQRSILILIRETFSHEDGFLRTKIVSFRLRGNNKAARHSHMNCAPTGAGYRIHQSTWWSTINMQQPPHTLLPRLLLSLLSLLFLSIFHMQTCTYTHNLLSSSFSSPLEKARFVSPQRALLQVPDWLLNWHSLKYPSNACRERYVWMKYWWCW